jgi:hypothetical protein
MKKCRDAAGMRNNNLYEMHAAAAAGGGMHPILHKPVKTLPLSVIMSKWKPKIFSTLEKYYSGFVLF